MLAVITFVLTRQGGGDGEDRHEGRGQDILDATVIHVLFLLILRLRVCAIDSLQGGRQ
jgi:hypothetical protein